VKEQQHEICILSTSNNKTATSKALLAWSGRVAVTTTLRMEIQLARSVVCVRKWLENFRGKETAQEEE